LNIVFLPIHLASSSRIAIGRLPDQMMNEKPEGSKIL